MQDEKHEVTGQDGPVEGWDRNEAWNLVRMLHEVGETAVAVIAQRGDLAGAQEARGVTGDAAERDIAMLVGTLLGAVTAFAQHWGLPSDLVASARERKTAWLDSLHGVGGDDWPVRESHELVETLALAQYAVAATVAADGVFEQLEVPRIDDEDVASEEWLADVFGQVMGALWTAAAWWYLPMDVVGDTHAWKYGQLLTVWGVTDVRDLESTDRHSAIALSHEARMEACERLLQGDKWVELAERVLADVMLTATTVLETLDVVVTAAQWCGAVLPPSSAGDDVVETAAEEWVGLQSAAGGGDALYIAVGLALADTEVQVRGASRTGEWTARDRRHVDRLVRYAGHELTPFERGLADDEDGGEQRG